MFVFFGSTCRIIFFDLEQSVQEVMTPPETLLYKTSCKPTTCHFPLVANKLNMTIIHIRIQRPRPSEDVVQAQTAKVWSATGFLFFSHYPCRLPTELQFPTVRERWSPAPSDPWDRLGQEGSTHWSRDWKDAFEGRIRPSRLKEPVKWDDLQTV